LFEITQEHDRAQDHSVLFGTNWNRVYNRCILNAQAVLAYLHTLKLIQGLSTSMQCINNSQYGINRVRYAIGTDLTQYAYQYTD
jgi:hypothetical protein